MTLHRVPPRPVHIGGFAADLDGADLLKIRFGGTEVVRRISVRVRGVGWSTIPGAVRPSASVEIRICPC